MSTPTKTGKTVLVPIATGSEEIEVRRDLLWGQTRSRMPFLSEGVSLA
jgi:hypothetical protein